MFATDTHFRALTNSVSGSLVNRLCWRSSTSNGMCSRRGGRLCRRLCPTINFRRLKLLRILERHRVFYLTWFTPLDMHRVGKVVFNPLNLTVQQGKIKIHWSIKHKQWQSRITHRVTWLSLSECLKAYLHFPLSYCWLVSCDASWCACAQHSLRQTKKEVTNEGFKWLLSLAGRKKYLHSANINLEL